MSIRLQLNTAKIFGQLLDRKNSTTSKIQYIPRKVEYIEKKCVHLQRSTPEEQGIPSELIAEYLDELHKGTEGRLHSAMIIRNGTVISECQFSPYSTNVWHTTFSLSKSITSLAIGRLVDEGKLSLDEKLVDIFEDQVSAVSKIRLRNLTVKHLLTMSSGVPFNEVGAVLEEDWLKSFLESGLKFEPGTKFMYNSMNSYVLAAIVKEKTGRGMVDYLRASIFEPMGLGACHWETCPKGIEKGGWGLYMLPEDMAKFGLLYLNKGNWQGKQLVSKEWMEEATKKQMEVNDPHSRYDYGYHIWVGEKANMLALNGMFGQNVIAFKDSNIVTAVTGGENWMFHDSKFFAISEKYFSKPPVFQDNLHLRKSQRILHHKLEELSEEDPYISKKTHLRQLKFLEGLSYDMEEAGSVGIMPIFIQAMQNNFTKGIKTIEFLIKDAHLVIKFIEEDGTYELPVGLGEYEESILNIRGEIYQVKVAAVFSKNEDDVPTLKVRLAFPELASSRFIRFYFKEEGFVSKWSEDPGVDFIMNMVEGNADVFGNKNLVELVTDKVDMHYVRHLLKYSFEPELLGTLKKK